MQAFINYYNHTRRLIFTIPLLLCASLAAQADDTHATGIDGTTVYLNDLQDHSWTLYQGVSSDVDGGHYNTAYKGRMYLANPKDVKITYYGNGTGTVINGSNTYNATTVQVGIDATANTFVYYKTLENYTTSGDAVYKYRTICNPFSVRPKQGLPITDFHIGA